MKKGINNNGVTIVRANDYTVTVETEGASKVKLGLSSTTIEAETFKIQEVKN